MQKQITILIVTGVVLAACGGGSGGDPTATVREAFKRLEAKQFDQLAELACADKQEEFAARFDFSGQMAASLPGVDAQKVLDAISVTTTGLDVREVSRSGNAAVVHVTGQLQLQFDTAKFKEILREVLKAQGLGEVDDAMLDQFVGPALTEAEQTTPLDDDVDMVNENGQWLICGDIGG